MSGAGTGELSKPGASPVAVVLAWRDDGFSGGTMRATLAGGEAFEGPYLQITHETSDWDLGPFWEGWDHGWSSWPRPYVTSGVTDDFTTSYTGHVVATLKSPTSRRLRCRFTLLMPASGMAGGGQGQCQSKDGSVLDATFPAR
jgi:hypothetical protein